MSEPRLRERIVETARRMNTLGINHGSSGNVSARVEGGFLVTPSAVPYDRLTPEDIVRVSLDGHPTGHRAPSSEWRFHCDLYASRPEVGAVLHAHSPFAVSLACLRRDIPPFHYMVALAGGHDVRCAPYATFGTQALSDAVLRAIDEIVSASIAVNSRKPSSTGLDSATAALSVGLVGLGVSASLMAAIKASSLWLPPERLPLSTSVLLSVGGLGAVASTAPMQFVVDAVGWRWGFVAIAGCAVAVAVLIGTVVPEHPARPAPTSVRAMARSVAQLYATPLFWRMSLCTLFSNGAYMAIQGLWLGPWLRDVGHLSRPDAAHVLFWSTLGMVLGSLSWGTLADRLRHHGVRPVTVCGVGPSPMTSTSASDRKRGAPLMEPR